jgi:hypothetical protein
MFEINAHRSAWRGALQVTCSSHPSPSCRRRLLFAPMKKTRTGVSRAGLDFCYVPV